MLQFGTMAMKSVRVNKNEAHTPCIPPPWTGREIVAMFGGMRLSNVSHPWDRRSLPSCSQIVNDRNIGQGFVEGVHQRHDRNAKARRLSGSGEPAEQLIATPFGGVWQIDINVLSVFASRQHAPTTRRQLIYFQWDGYPIPTIMRHKWVPYNTHRFFLIESLPRWVINTHHWLLCIHAKVTG
jgi:hypothetical protein